MSDKLTDPELEQLREDRLAELREVSTDSNVFGGGDLLLVAVCTLIIPAIALVWGWFAWV